MFMVKDSICLAGGILCEDAIGFSDKFIFALDGASCLTGINLVHPQSDAYWFAQGVKDGLCRKLKEEPEASTEDILKEVIAPLREEYLNCAKEKNIEIPDDSPSAGIALFRLRENTLEFYGLGDCVGVIAMKDGTKKWLNDPSLSNLDSIVIGKMAQLHKETGIDVIEARKLCTDLLIKHRALKNKPEGYRILDPLGEGIDYACKFSITLDEIESVSVFSDGFAQLSEVFRVFENFGELHEALRTRSLENLCKELFFLQDNDPVCNSYPRFKLRDDTCAVYAEIN